LGLAIGRQEGVPFQLIFGIQVHSLFNQWIKAYGYEGNNTFSGLYDRSRPDAYNAKRKSVIELKPMSWQYSYKYGLAQFQLNQYIALANTNDELGGWSLGDCASLLEGKNSTYIGDIVHLENTYNIYVHPDKRNSNSGLLFYSYELADTANDKLQRAASKQLSHTNSRTRVFQIPFYPTPLPIP